jgi:hypothetical protein
MILPEADKTRGKESQRKNRKFRGKTPHPLVLNKLFNEKDFALKKT